MISKNIKISYYSPVSRVPSIIRPYNNNHWQTGRVVDFVFIYNGFDLQLEYQIQIYSFDSKENTIPSEWFSLVVEGDDDVSSYVGDPVVDISSETVIQNITLDLSAISPFSTLDGSYLWRVRTRGTVANQWSNWNPNGLVNLDKVAPVLKNICSESPSSYDLDGKPNMASYISDMSMPYIYTNRTDVIKDRNIDRTGKGGLYIYYNYRDNSIVLRAQKGSSSSNPRFYGLISFHSTENELSPDYNVQSAIKAAYLYKINKDYVDGPFEKIRYDEHESEYLIGDSLSKLIYTKDSGTTVNDFIPKGFPKFWQGNGIYDGTSVHEKHPAGMDRSISFFSSFPISSRKVTRKLTFPVASPSTSTQTFTDCIEMIYPAPYNDLFVLFDSSMDNILAYGQYKSADLYRLNTDITGTFNFVLKRGLDVRSWKNSLESKPNPASNILYQFWTTLGTTVESLAKDNPNKRGPVPDFTSSQLVTDNIRSNNLFFNLNADDDNDNVLKIYLRPKAIKYIETGLSEKIDVNAIDQISFIDFNMSPDSDCSFSGISAGGNNVDISSIFIGKAKISPKALSYSERNPTDKKILINSKNPPIPFVTDLDLTSDTSIWTTVKKWGCSNSISSFIGTEDNYNASFRLKIPLFRYVPYYHPGSVNYLESPTNPQPPIPNIYDADPNKNSDDVIGWDTLTLETKENSSYSIEALPISSVIYPSDAVQFMGTAKQMGQISPYLYNFEELSKDGVSRGTIARVRDYKVFQPYLIKPEEYYYLGQSMYEDGWFYDGTHFNDIDRGYYSIGNVERNITETTSSLSLIDFSSYLFRKSLDLVNKTTLSKADEFSSSFFAIDGQSGDNEDTTLIEDTLLNFSKNYTLNGKSWIYSLLTDSDSSNFREALIRGDDVSIQSFFGISGEPDTTWLEDTSNPFGGQYIDLRDSDVDTANQIKRIISVSGSDFNYSNFSPINRFDIPQTPASDKSLKILGDAFSLGNIFGYIIPNPSGKIKIFFDADEADSGIKSIKIFQVNLDDSDSNLKDCAHFIGPKNSSNKDTEIAILMQKINNREFDISDPSSLTSAISAISSSRSPIELYEYYFDNNIALWESADKSSKSIEDWSSGRKVVETLQFASNESGYFYETTISGTGLKLIFIQIKDRSDNVSALYPIPVFIPAAATVEPFSSLESTAISVDDGDLIKEISSITVGINTYNFVKSKLTNDIDKSRAIVIKKLLIKNDDVYEPANNVDELVAGFSDNYGLSYNIYSPLSSINTWRFTRPISIRVKSYTKDQRLNEPMWYFDPNHVRHYASDTDSDFTYYNTNSKIQANNSLTSITLLGLQLKNGSSNDFNPVAKKILQFKEEFIGKTLKFGNIGDQDFKIVHIFQGILNSITKPSGDNAQRTIDGDSESKVWIVIEDPDAIAAMIASRKFQYIVESGDNFNEAKKYTYKVNSSGFASIDSSNFTQDFGYEINESDIDSSTNNSINTALKMNGNITSQSSTAIVNIPANGSSTVFNEGELSIYILPSSSDSSSSGITTNEGWTTQIFQAFVLDSNGNLIKGASSATILDNLSNRQFIGTNIYNKLLFGENHTTTSNILSSTYDVSSDSTVLILTGDLFDETMASLDFKILDITNNIYIILPRNTIKSVSTSGDALLVDGDISSYFDFSNDYQIILELSALDSSDLISGTLLPNGFWPSIDGIVVPPLGSRLGTISSSNNSARNQVDFAIISNGAFYIPETGDYLFKLEIDSSSNSYADLAIDFLASSSVITDVVENGTGGFEVKNVGGYFNTNVSNPSKTFTLTKGWHIGRLRYIAVNNDNPNYCKVSYSKSKWNDTTKTVPMIGDNSGQYTFLTRNYKSVHCKILDQNFDQKYPINSMDKANQYARAILGFITELQDISSTTTSNQVSLIKRKDSTSDFGERISSTLPEASPTFGGQIYEEVFGIYLSNIFDGGTDMRFWKTISWTPDQSSFPTGTSVQFEVRTAATESELLTKEFNTLQINDKEVKIDPFTVSGSNILNFSFTGGGDNPDNIVINRFIQVKMTLKSKVRDVFPSIDDFTITYSKQNSVNFFTNTFNLKSNLVRALLVYNGDNKFDSNQVALTDIQFGISTEEVVDGEVTTNFSNYKIIPVNEAFSLNQIGLETGKNFKIGIRLIASSEEVPDVDEFALLWESEGQPEQINKDVY